MQKISVLNEEKYVLHLHKEDQVLALHVVFKTICQKLWCYLLKKSFSRTTNLTNYFWVMFLLSTQRSSRICETIRLSNASHACLIGEARGISWSDHSIYSYVCKPIVFLTSIIIQMNKMFSHSLCIAITKVSESHQGSLNSKWTIYEIPITHPPIHEISSWTNMVRRLSPLALLIGRTVV